MAGIQVKVKEALLDKVKYAANDSMQLALTIESNQDLATTLRTWVVDPAGSYTEAGSGSAALTAAAPSLSTLNSQLLTASLGIHKLVYGIYQGDLLLASGAKAFDIGEAVLLGLATDKSDYPEITLPVAVKVELYGTVAAGIELFLDGASIKSDTVTLSGTGSYTHTIPPTSLAPGLHTLKALLSVGGLTSNRELRFTYGSSLPDLTGRLAALPPNGAMVNLSLTVTNQGKAAAGANRAALYNGDPASGGQLLALLDVPALAAGSSVTLPYAWNVLGKSAEQVLYARVDSDNSVTEFIEANNTAITAVSLPSVSLAVASGNSTYGAHEAAVITVSIANLTTDLPLASSTLKLRLTSAAGMNIDLPDRSVATIAPATVTTLAEVWNTGDTLPSTCTLTARLVSGATELAAATGTFTIVPTTLLSGSIAPAVAEVPQDGSLTALFSITNSGNTPLDGTLQGAVRDPQSGITMAVQELPLQLAVGGVRTGTFTFPVAGLVIKGYDLLLRFVSGSSESIVGQSQFTIKDTIPPVLTVSTLSNGSSTNNGVLNISGTVTDNTGVRDLFLNSTVVPFNSDGSFSLPLVLNPGDNLIEVKAVDLANNPAIDSRTITLDQHAPSLTITAPADNSKTATALLDVSGTVDETAIVQVKLGDTVQTAAMTGTAFTAGVALASGGNTIDITAIDLAGNSSSQKRSVVYDDRKPSLAITLPAQDIRTSLASLLLQGSVADPYTSVTVGIAMDGQSYAPPVENGQFEQQLTFATEKSYAIMVTATNEVGSTTTAQRNVIYDITGPLLTINPVTTPTSLTSQTLSGTRESGLPVNVACPTATIGTVSYPTETIWTVPVNGMQPGDNSISATATDLAGNTTTVTTKITLANAGSNRFSYALFANRSITLSGSSYLDSYVGNTSSHVKGLYRHGNAGSNATQLCSIKLTGGTMVYGNASIGVGGSPATTVCTTIGTTITGGSDALAAARDLTPVAAPTGFTSLGGLNLSGVATRTLTSGTYRYSSLSLGGSAKLNISGQVTLIVDGNLSLSGAAQLVVTSGAVVIYVSGSKFDVSGGALVNMTQNPSNLIVYGSAALTTVNLSGGTSTSMIGLIHAPAATVKVSGSQQTFGAIVGNSIDLSGATSVHFPESLLN